MRTKDELREGDIELDDEIVEHVRVVATQHGVTEDQVFCNILHQYVARAAEKVEAGEHMKEIAPTMPVADLDRATAFYQDMLGFVTLFHNPRVFALLQRGRVKIGLQRANERPPGTGNCYIWVDDIRSIYGELRDKGISFEDDIAARDEYALTDFVVHDLDGNFIGIGGEE